ncbi:hypothetical protein NVP1081O_277 [Vibrio phage 1.081.O._10N.286.52.C2]|nr:hypothetical protein NVP1081O_277 [Vibrio phage 1.081.O._10N.286.52.C2]
MAFTKIDLIAKRSRRSVFIPAGEWYFDLNSTQDSRDSNYFSILAQFDAVQFAFGGRWNEKHVDADPDDPLPTFDQDFITVYHNGHYESQGNLFNSSLRIWVKSVKGFILVY